MTRSAEDFTFLEAWALAKHNWKTVVAGACAFALLLAGLAFFRDDTFTSSVLVMPSTTEHTPNRLGSVAAQFGLNLGTSNVGGSLDYFAELANSRRVLERVGQSGFRSGYAASGANLEEQHVDLATALRLEIADPQLRTATIVGWARARLRFTPLPASGVLRISVETHDPQLSRDYLSRLVDVLNQESSQVRQNQASAELVFVEQQLERARQDLLEVEDSLESFLEANRSYASSPELRLQYERIQRRVSLRQQVYGALAENRENVRLAEVRNTPLLNVVDPPFMPLNPDHKNLPVLALLGALSGALIVVGTVLGREIWSRYASVTQSSERS